MRRVLIMIIFAGFVTPATVNAQKVRKENNKVILDLTPAARMPKDAITTTGKTWTGTPSNTEGPMANNSEVGTINATVFQKLEIAPHDINSVGTIGTAGTMTMDWVTAFGACKSTTYDNGGWRLPTQRELMLIYIFRSAIEVIFKDSSINGTVFSTTYYHSATESTNYSSYCWGVNLSNGVSSIISKVDGGSKKVRCVREITN